MIRRLWLWSLDYWYVAWHQWRGLFIRRVPDAFAYGPLTPVLLVPGVWEPWYFLRGIGRRLNAAGHPVHVVRAIGYNRASVAEVAALASAYLDEHALEHVVVVAHSKGGLVGKRLLAHPRVDRLIAIATPFSGSAYANYLPGRTLAEFRPTNAALLALAGDVASNARVVSVYPRFDPHIPAGSALEGAVNIEIPTTGHFRILGDERVLRAVEAALESSPEPGVE